MGKVSNTRVRVLVVDRNIEFNSSGEQDLKVGEGIPVVSSGSKVNGNATAHGTVPGTSILIHSPA
jgi:hypothetical protein